MRLDRFLARRLPDLSRAFVQKLARRGHVLLDGAPARSSRAVRAGQTIRVTVPEPEPVALVPEPIPIQVLHEDADLLVVNKPAGMVVHPGAGVRSGTLVHALLARGERWSTIGGELRPGIVHRLDRGTSGVMVVARNDAAHRALSAQFKDRLVEKVYYALAWGSPREDLFTVAAPLGRDLRQRKRVSSRTARPREASTTFRVLERLGLFSALEVRPRTGRTHQIRAHLKSVNHPIVGDREYGGLRWRGLAEGEVRERIRLLDRLALHAWRLRFRHPATGLVASFQAPLPEALTGLQDAIRRAPEGP